MTSPALSLQAPTLPDLCDLDPDADPFAALPPLPSLPSPVPSLSPSSPASPPSSATPRPVPTASKPAPASTVVALPVRSAVPISWARSALFGARALAKGSRQALTDVSLCTKGLNATLSYKGPILTQRHALVWQACVAAAADAGTHQFSIAASRLLALFGARSDGKALTELWRHLEELVDGTVKVSSTFPNTLEGLTHTYVGHLIDHASKVMTTGENPKLRYLSVRLSPEITHLLQDRVVRDTLPTKAKIPRNHLALWLIDWISSHNDFPTTPVEEIRRLCGSNNQALRGFRFALRAALTRLQSADIGLIVSWKIDAQDRLQVQKQKTSICLLEPARSKADRAKAVAKAVAVIARETLGAPCEDPATAPTPQEQTEAQERTDRQAREFAKLSPAKQAAYRKACADRAKVSI
jgi:hypothetical protein